MNKIASLFQGTPSPRSNHWHNCRLKNIALLNPTLSLSKFSPDDHACFLPMEDVSVLDEPSYSIQKKIKNISTGLTNFERGDIIIAKITPCFENGKGACLDKMPSRLGFGSTEFHVLRPGRRASSRFLYFLTMSSLFMKQGEAFMTGSAGQKRVPSSFVANFYLPVPPLSEQQLVARFLEEKTTQIDKGIGIKKQQITLLKEHKQVLIQNAVTRGLDPDAPMRDSGIGWIGKIPEHWEIQHNRSLFSERVEPGQEGLSLLTVSIHSGVSSGELSEDENLKLRVRIEDQTKYSLVQPDDIVYNMMRAWQGAIGAVTTTGMVSPAYTVATPDSKIRPKFFEYLYRTPLFIHQMDCHSKGITDFRKRLYWQEFKQLITLVPPLDEQVRIVRHIDQVSTKIDKAIALFQGQIERLKEYRATLIDNAVTGKIRVPGVEEPAKEEELAR